MSEISRDLISMMGFIAGANAALEARSRRERPLPSNYCPKCKCPMNRASKHKLVCPKCKNYKEF